MKSAMSFTEIKQFCVWVNIDFPPTTSNTHLNPWQFLETKWLAQKGGTELTLIVVFYPVVSSGLKSLDILSLSCKFIYWFCDPAL